MTPQEIVTAVTDSGLRGRGGAGFPTGIKWQTVLDRPRSSSSSACNADEGDSGTFADRMLMEGDPFFWWRAWSSPGWRSAHRGHVYIRSEYPDAVATMSAAIDIAYLNGWVGPSVLGTDRAFDLHLRVGAGSYICGEETAMLESLEGRRGVIRAKPPLPAIAGLFGKPTVVNNVLSLATVPPIIAKGAEAFRELGVGRSRGTQVFQLAGNIKHGGIVETAFGITLASSSRNSAAALRVAGRCGLSRSVAPLGPTCRRAASTCRWTTRPSPPPAPWWVTGASSSSTKPST